MIGATLQQTYFVTRIKTYLDSLPEMDFTGRLSCQMFPSSHYSARLVVTQPDRILTGAMGFGNLKLSAIWPALARFPARLRCIEYTIAACPGDNKSVYTESFFHPFKNGVMLSGTGEMAAHGGRLFKTEPLDFLLDVKEFGDTRGIQFVG